MNQTAPLKKAGCSYFLLPFDNCRTYTFNIKRNIVGLLLLHCTDFSLCSCMAQMYMANSCYSEDLLCNTVDYKKNSVC